MNEGNCIEGIEKFETNKEDKKEKNKKIYDKVLKAMGLTEEVLDGDK